MVEVIKEFEKQCTVEIDPFYRQWQPTKLNTKKFAELIVLECIDICLKNSHRDDDMGAIISRQIKQHFGVE